MAKKLFMTMLLALVGTMMSWGVNYDLYVSGTRVTSSNAGDLSGISGVTGTAYYTASQNTLYLSDVTIMPSSSTTYSIYASGGVSGLKISVSGVNTIISTGSIAMCFQACGNVEITGGGTLIVKAKDYDIFFTSDRLTISNGTSVHLLGGGIYNDGNADETLEVNNANLFVHRKIVSNSAIEMNDLVLTNAHLVLPNWSSFEWDGYELYRDGQYWKDDICIRAGSASSGSGDVNGDGDVNLADVTKLVNIILDKDDPHEYVDLGLPSGTLWATCNVGANSPEEYGQCFMWGETTGHKFVHGVVDGFSFNEATVPYCNGALNAWTKYCTDSSIGYNGFTDGKTELELMDDAAYVNWGPKWRMPTKEQAQELLDYTKFYRTTLNDVEVIVIQSLINNKILYFPLTGRRNRDGWYLYNEAAYIWTRTLDDNSRRAWNIMWRRNSESVYYETLDNTSFRFFGFAIRPVRAQ